MQMPYLHWETDRKRNAFSDFLEKATIKHKTDKRNHEQGLRNQRHNFRRQIARIMAESASKAIVPEKIHKRSQPEQTGMMSGIAAMAKSSLDILGLKHKSPPQKGPIGQERTATMRTVVESMGFAKEGLEVKHGRVITKSLLGQYLIDAARLYEAMSNYRDKKLVEKYLHLDPPLHPRRTLDQAYYWTLNTTKSRDRDQVVYRGTRAPVSQLHQFDLKNQCWPKHDELRIEGACDTCRANIRRVSRLVMVDQLWMWVLDKKTIITLFPKRYGANKNDGSGVHKSIRARLKTAQKNQIRSIFDLALIIIDECSNTFFDRTKTPDRQPQVLDIFSEAIGNVVCNHSGSDRFIGAPQVLTRYDRHTSKRQLLRGYGSGPSVQSPFIDPKRNPTRLTSMLLCLISIPRANYREKSRISSKSWTS
jgi:hypothetical protein